MTASAGAARILVVANRTNSTPALLEEVARRAREGARFTLLIPPEKSARGRAEDWQPEDALRLVSGAAGDTVATLDPGSDAVDTIHDAIGAGSFDAIIVSAAPEHVARWVHHDIAHRIRHMGLPVTVIDPEVDLPFVQDKRDGSEIIAPGGPTEGLIQ